jgi:hypothetical protein
MIVGQDEVLYDTNRLKFDSKRAQNMYTNKGMNWRSEWIMYGIMYGRRSLWLGAKQNGLNPNFWVDMVVKVNEWQFFQWGLCKSSWIVMKQFVLKNGPS